jgi:hypothetical protein
MNRRLTPSEKRKRGTFRPCRDAAVVELIEPDALPIEPDWLTAEGRCAWMENIGRVAASRLVGEIDSSLFAVLCNLQGNLAACWATGEVPPASHLGEFRRLCELFGLAGARSRLLVEVSRAASNPFARNGKRAADG